MKYFKLPDLGEVLQERRHVGVIHVLEGRDPLMGDAEEGPGRLDATDAADQMIEQALDLAGGDLGHCRVVLDCMVKAAAR